MNPNRHHKAHVDDDDERASTDVRRRIPNHLSPCHPPLLGHGWRALTPQLLLLWTPVCNEDVRPSVLDLIEKNRKTIDAVKQALEKDPLYTAEKHDDLWIFRFVLSHKKKVKEAVKAATSTLKYRKEHKLDVSWMFDNTQHPPAPGDTSPLSQSIENISLVARTGL
jgi:hypothetical protein